MVKLLCVAFDQLHELHALCQTRQAPILEALLAHQLANQNIQITRPSAGIFNGILKSTINLESSALTCFQRSHFGSAEVPTSQRTQSLAPSGGSPTTKMDREASPAKLLSVDFLLELVQNLGCINAFNLSHLCSVFSDGFKPAVQ